MYLILYAALGMILFTASTTLSTQRHVDAATNDAVSQVGQYRLFMYTADQYLAANPSATGTLAWSTLKTVPSAPSGVASAVMPATWKVVVPAGGKWVACTTIDSRGVKLLLKTATADKRTAIPYITSTTGDVTIVTPSDPTAPSLSSCN